MAKYHRLYIRPVYKAHKLLPESFALVTTNEHVMCDSQVLIHFPMTAVGTNGRMIKETAVECGYVDDKNAVLWGNIIDI